MNKRNRVIHFLSQKYGIVKMTKKTKKRIIPINKLCEKKSYEKKYGKNEKFLKNYLLTFFIFQILKKTTRKTKKTKVIKNIT